MKLECIKENLQTAIGKAEKIVAKNTSLPVLKLILLSLEKNTLKVRATNLELGVEITIPVKGSEDGVVAISGSFLLSFLNSTKEKQANIDTHGNSLLVSTKNSSAVINTHEVEDFPELPQVPEENVFTIKKQDLLSGFRSVWFAASTSSIKPELSSVYIRPYEDGLTFVATDSFRLSEKRILAKGFSEVPPFLIPIKNVLEIMKMIEDASDVIKTSVTKNQISLQVGGVYITSRVVDGNFPDYQQIIPKEFITNAKALKEDVLSALKTASLFSDKFNQVKVVVDKKKKTCEFQAKSSEIGEGAQSLSATIEGDDVEINFNYKYLQDCFQAIAADSVSLQFNGSHKPLVIRGSGDTSFLYLVMPMNR